MALTRCVQLSNGRTIPVLGLGTWQAKPGEIKEVVKQAISIGYRHFDCAYFYQNEEEIGAALEDQISSGAVQREDLFITSKVWNTFHSRSLVFRSLEESLKKLRLSYLDLYLIHWPMGFQEGGSLFPVDENGNALPSDVDFLETWSAMEECCRRGLVKSIGVSNFNSAQIDRLLASSQMPPVLNQVECHPYLNQKKLLDFCKQRNIRLSAYSPLGSPGNPWARPDEPHLLKDDKVTSIAKRLGRSAGQVLLSYQLQRGLIVVSKSSNATRLRENFESQSLELTPEDMDLLDSLDRNHRYYAMNE